ncbi:helix-turn-helix domain-containing protein [Aliivibrio fischeri]|uniref:HTH cro/C1-type domain-containing protein n=1 Tax=Aliivibrio fischeri TaxID=668 RepID=A0A510UL53_ALIFS|nr:helix-turn-helix transcriptional regulator [Aliivibrio fischeri]GEK15364.1 hypothetical protein AFI02nite_34000 [Aliivibrio fischeri]
MDKNEIDSKIHKQLKVYVTASGLSNSELARRCGVDRATVGRWLKSGNISRNNLVNLCSVLGISEGIFFKSIELPDSDTPYFTEKKKIVITKIKLLHENDSTLLDIVDKLLS